MRTPRKNGPGYNDSEKNGRKDILNIAAVAAPAAAAAGASVVVGVFFRPSANL